MSLIYPNKNISVIVIAYNAENTVKDIINDIPRDYVDDVIVGDDYSTDGTFELIKEIDDNKATKTLHFFFKKSIENL